MCERMGWYSGHKEKRMGLKRTVRRAGCSIREVDLVSRILSLYVELDDRANNLDTRTVLLRHRVLYARWLAEILRICCKVVLSSPSDSVHYVCTADI